MAGAGRGNELSGQSWCGPYFQTLSSAKPDEAFCALCNRNWGYHSGGGEAQKSVMMLKVCVQKSE